MKGLRLLGLSLALLLFAVAQAKPAYAACGKCTTNSYCRSCSGYPDAYCVGGRCAV